MSHNMYVVFVYVIRRNSRICLSRYTSTPTGTAYIEPFVESKSQQEQQKRKGCVKFNMYDFRNDYFNAKMRGCVYVCQISSKKILHMSINRTHQTESTNK